MMTLMRWGIAMLLVLSVTTTLAGADVECSNQNTAVSATTPTAEFVMHGDGTVTHTRTGLMWMRCSLGQTWSGSSCTGSASAYTWRNALNAAQDVNFAGHTDWRLPNKNELESIVERSCWNPAINTALFPNTPSGWYFSSSPNAFSSGSAWDVDFNDGHVGWNDGDSGSVHVRLVRVGQ